MSELKLYKFQEQAIEALQQPKKHIVISSVGSGKGAMMLHWLKSTGKKKWLVVTTPSKRDSGDVEKEMCDWFGKESQSSYSLTVISWAGLAKWTIANWKSLEEYAYAFDEIAKAKAGNSSERGSAFLKITKHVDDWTGYTATPGDRWDDFYAYFIAGGYVKNKTEFRRNYCQIQTFKGFPEVIGYNHVGEMRKWWAEMTVCPDTSEMLAELPPERHHTVKFKPDPYYKTLLKTLQTKEGDFLDTTGAFCAYARKLSFTKQKRQWLADYLEGLGTNAVLFYNFTSTGDEIEKLAYKALPKGAKVWRIYGKAHDIPRPETIGKYDIVLCQWQAGAEALNLQFMNQWVSVEPCYAYSTSEQARGRIKRIGQKHANMQFWYLWTENTIDDRIYETLKSKSDFSERNWVIKEGITGLREEPQPEDIY